MRLRPGTFVIVQSAAAQAARGVYISDGYIDMHQDLAHPGGPVLACLLQGDLR